MSAQHTEVKESLKHIWQVILFFIITILFFSIETTIRTGNDILLIPGGTTKSYEYVWNKRKWSWLSF